MPAEEREVCKRLLTFRRSRGLSRAAFARFVGMDPQLLASYELGRSQVNYPAAFRILSRFPELNPAWLAGEEDLMEVDAPITYPSPDDLEFGPRTAFTWVYDGELRKRVNAQRSPWVNRASPEPYFLLTADPAGRLRAEQMLRLLLRRWLAYLPDSRLNDFLDALKRAGAALLEANLKSEGLTEEGRRSEAMQRIAQVRKLQLEHEAAIIKGGTGKDILDYKSGSVNVPGMRLDVPSWAQLKKTIARLTAERGAKAALAEELGVSRQVLNNWLSTDDQGRPDAELTLRLLQWSLDPKRKTQ
jgi:transcriptional regulator with XRE-family HTH domain